MFLMSSASDLLYMGKGYYIYITAKIYRNIQAYEQLYVILVRNNSHVMLSVAMILRHRMHHFTYSHHERVIDIATINQIKR